MGFLIPSLGGASLLVCISQKLWGLQSTQLRAVGVSTLLTPVRVLRHKFGHRLLEGREEPIGGCMDPLVLRRIRRLREQYFEAHRKGMTALWQRDLDALSEAIEAERKILDQQKQLITVLRAQALVQAGR